MNRSLISIASRCLVVALALFAGSSAMVQAQDDQQFDQWVSALADQDPESRRDAESSILAAGEKALPAVKAGLKSTSLEISSRCKILLEKIELKQKRELSKMFLADDFETADLSAFRAWPAFKKFAGREDVGTRKLFLKMCHELESAFEGYAIRGDATAESLKKQARLVLIRENNRSASAISKTAGYLFLANQAGQSFGRGQLDELFDKVETFEAMRFFANYSNGKLIRESEFREVIENKISDWVGTWEGLGRITDEAKSKLIYQTSNMALISKLNDDYEKLTADQRLRFIDVVFRATATKEKGAWMNCRQWLQKPLEDETIAVTSRVRKEPARQIDVSIRMLAEGMMTRAIKNSVGTGEPVKAEAIFGSFPLSSTTFLIVRSEKDIELMSKYLSSDSQPKR